MESVKLCELKTGDKAVLSRIEGVEISRHKRLIELGLVGGAKIEVLKKEKNIMLVGVRGYALSLDGLVTNCIEVYRG